LRCATVNRYGLAGLGGDRHLRGKCGLLCRNIGIVQVVVVEADLANGNTARVGNECPQARKVFLRSLVCFLRMDAGSREDLRMQVRQLQRPVHGVGAFADADGQQGADAGFFGARDHAGQVFVVVKMAVGINDLHKSLSTRVPRTGDALGLSAWMKWQSAKFFASPKCLSEKWRTAARAATSCVGSSSRARSWPCMSRRRLPA